MSNPGLGGGLNLDKISFFRLFPAVILQSLSGLFYDAHIKYIGNNESLYLV